MRTFETLADIRKAGEGKELFVRWSRGPESDAQMNWTSTNYQTGYQEYGLSVVRLDTDSSDYDMYYALAEYRFLTHPVCYILTGTVVGRGSDGEPVLEDCEVLGLVHDSLILDVPVRELLRLEREVVECFQHLARLRAMEKPCPTSVAVAVTYAYKAQRDRNDLKAGVDWYQIKRRGNLWYHESARLVAHWNATGEILETL